MYRYQRIILVLALSVSALALVAAPSPAEAAPPLKAPWACGDVYPVSQSHNTGSHVGKGRWSWDFAMPVGTQLIAPAEGVVREVRQDSTSYGCNPSYAYDANYIIIAFNDGTEALFLHLEANSVPVAVGDRVYTGDPIGRVGMSGWTCGPHLHFQVQKTCDSWWCRSIAANFETWGDPIKGQQITSRNCSQPTEESQMASVDPDAGHATGGGEDKACFID